MTELGYERSLREWVLGQGMRWERLRYPRPEAGGETLAYRLGPASPPRALVLTAHGAGNDALFSMAGLFKSLLLRGFEIFAFDLDGHGRNSTTTFAPATVSGALPAALERSGARERGLAAHAVGISLGGSLLVHALPRLAVASAVIVSAPLRVDLSWRAMLHELGPPLARTLWRERGHHGLWGLVPSFGPVKRATYPLRLAVTPGRGSFGYVETINATLEDLRLLDAARAVSAPVLLIYGGEDRLVPPEQGRDLAREIPHAELLELDRETHLTTPLAPAATRRALEWLDAASPPAA